MSKLYVTVVIDLDDGQSQPGLGPVTTWPAWDGEAQTGIASIPQTALLTGSGPAPSLRVRASDDPLLGMALTHYWEENLSNAVQNPPTYSGQINYADGATQYLSALRLRMLATEAPDPTVAYVPRAEWLSANGFAHPDGTTILQAEDGTLSAVGGGTSTIAGAEDYDNTTPAETGQAITWGGAAFAPADLADLPVPAPPFGVPTALGTVLAGFASAGDLLDLEQSTSQALGILTGQLADLSGVTDAATARANIGAVTAAFVGGQIEDFGAYVDDQLAAEALARTTADGLLLAKADNLASLADKAAARTNLQLGGAATKNVGTAAGTVASGDDSRFTDARTPTGHHATHSTGGGDPIAPGDIGAATAAGLAQELTDRAAADALLLVKANNLSDLANAGTARTNLGLGTAATTNTGTGATNTILGNDARLTDARTPTAHATSHVTGGSDVIPAAVASGNAGLLTGADKAKLDGIAAGAQPGTVTSVGLSVPGLLYTVTNSPVTGAGTLTLTAANVAANLFPAGPASGAAAPWTLRALVAADLPSISLTAGVSGILPAANGGTGINNGSNTLTVPASGTAALLGTSNLFSVRQDIRGSGSGQAAGLYIPWISGDTVSTLVVGAGTSGNNQNAVSGLSNTGVGVFGSGAGSAGSGMYGTGGDIGVLGETTTGTAPFYGRRINGSAAALNTGLLLTTRSSSTPSAGFGGAILFQNKSSTNNDQAAAQVGAAWSDATHISRASYLVVQTNVAGSVTLVDRARFDGSTTANDTGLQLWDANSSTLKRVVVGAADSGGTGYRLLRIVN